MFSLDTKQWENVAEGLLSTVTKTDTPPTDKARTKNDSDSETVIDFVAVRSDER